MASTTPPRSAIIAICALALCAFVVGIILPATGRTHDDFSGMAVRSRLQIVADAMVQYGKDNSGAFPPHDRWAEVLRQDGSIGEEMFDSMRIESAPGAPLGSEFVYTPPTDATGAPATFEWAAANAPGWILLREDESRLPKKRHLIVCVTLEDGVPIASEVMRDEFVERVRKQEARERVKTPPG